MVQDAKQSKAPNFPLWLLTIDPICIELEGTGFPANMFHSIRCIVEVLTMEVGLDAELA